MPADQAEIIQVRNPATGHVFEYAGEFPYPPVLDDTGSTNPAVRRRIGEERHRELLGKIPYEVKKHVDSGDLEYVGRREPDDQPPATGPATPPGVGRPAGNASQEAWINYALSQGMPHTEAAALSRDELRARFSDTGFDPASPPSLNE
jgi:hypothetical protein